MTRTLIRTLLLWAALLAGSACAQSAQEYPLSAGDSIRIFVFQNPELGIEARVSETGTINYPLVGLVNLGGLSITEAEKKIADALKAGGFVQKPQVNIVLQPQQLRPNQVAVLGQVNRPGRFPLEIPNTRVSDMLAAAGGVVPGSGAFAGGDDVAIITGARDGKPFRKEIDIPALYLGDRPQDDVVVAGGDTIFVPRAAVFYIYGEAQRTGVYRIERSMTIMQALATGGGPTMRGTERRVRLHRKNAAGVTEQIAPKMTDPVLPNDVLYVRESLF
jgi:polysaccharide export outer membrane protein